jgi:WD40 repeat protein
MCAVQGQVFCVQFSANGRLLATASRDATCRIFDAETGTTTCVITHPARVTCCAFAPSGNCSRWGHSNLRLRLRRESIQRPE